MAACTMLVSCGVFGGKQPPRQCFEQGNLRVILTEELQIIRDSQHVSGQPLRGPMPVVTGVKKDTVMLTYFAEQHAKPEEGLANTGQNVWLRWKTVPLQELIISNTINVTQYGIRNGRLEVQPAGSAVKLSFAMNNIVFDKERILAFTHSPYKSTCREIKLPEEPHKAFQKQFRKYGEAWEVKQ